MTEFVNPDPRSFCGCTQDHAGGPVNRTDCPVHADSPVPPGVDLGVAADEMVDPKGAVAKQRERIADVIDAMPYTDGGGFLVQNSEAQFLNSLANRLEELRDTLVVVKGAVTAMDTELQTFREQRQAVRSFLGTF